MAQVHKLQRPRRTGGTRHGPRPSQFGGIAALVLVMGLAVIHYHGPGLAPAGTRPQAEVAGSADAHRPFPICSSGARVDCVVDGDTFWFNGEKVRIADIDTPEIFSPRCGREKKLGERATRRLHALLNEGPIELRRAGRERDRYGRLLRTVHRDGRSLGAVLVDEGLARRWEGARRSWCG